MGALEKIRSYARLTDLIFARFSGSVIDRDDYVLIRTPDNPGFHWGNYLIMSSPPKKGSYPKWKKLFEEELGAKTKHSLFTWDSPEKGEPDEFLEAGYELSTSAVLTAKTLGVPPHPSSRVEVRALQSEKDWQAAVELQMTCADPKYLNASYRSFKEKQMESYRRMAEAGIGAWFGAFTGPELVADLGLFYENGIARYQNVETHPEFRRQGICGTLVHTAGKTALEKWGVHTLVMEADVHYHAARVYESVGFERAEINHALTWWERT